MIHSVLFHFTPRDLNTELGDSTVCPRSLVYYYIVNVENTIKIEKTSWTNSSTTMFQLALSQKIVTITLFLYAR